LVTAAAFAVLNAAMEWPGTRRFRILPAIQEGNLTWNITFYMFFSAILMSNVGPGAYSFGQYALASFATSKRPNYQLWPESGAAADGAESQSTNR